VHEEKPVLFGTRWALSYLRGPLTREEIVKLVPTLVPLAARAAGPRLLTASEVTRPAVPPELEEKFVAALSVSPGARVVYRPALLGVATLRYADAKAGVDHFERVTLLRELGDAVSWEGSGEVALARLELGAEPLADAGFEALPPGLGKGSAERLGKTLATHLQQARPLRLWRSAEAGLGSRPGEGEGAFRVRVREALREQRDATLEKLRAKYAPKLARAEQRVRRAAEEVERQRSQRNSEALGTAISVGATVLGALFGRRSGVGTIGRATTAARGATRAAREQGDVARAGETHATAEAELRALDAEFQTEVAALRGAGAEPVLSEVLLRPRKTDTQVERVALVWLPHRAGDDGRLAPAFAALA
jgi:hypothetical protein